MCVLLCANPKVHEWLDLPLARAYRQSLQLCALCPVPRTELVASGVGTDATSCVTVEIAEACLPHVMKRSAWLQVYCRRMAACRESAQDRHNPFDVITNAWGRLLAFVGLRR